MDHQDPYELIDGVLYEMPSEGYDHVDYKMALAEWLIRNDGLTDLRIIVDSTLYLSDHDAPDPDIYVYPRQIPLRDLKGSDVRLVIEVANSSLRKDKELKAPLYEKFGIQEYWIVDLETGDLLVYRRGADGAYGEPVSVKPEETVTPASIPNLSVKLADLSRLD